MPDPSAITLEITFNYTAPSGDTRQFEIVMPVTSPAVRTDEFVKGYYRDMAYRFTWPKTMPEEINSRSWTSSAVVVVPNIHKIPVYMHAGALNEPFYEPIVDVSYRYFDYLRLNNMFRYKHEIDVGRIATDANNEINKNLGCSGWYQFRFYGYLDHDWLEDGIDEPGEISKLPHGITLVPNISRCGNRVDTIFGFPGCATLDGTRIVLDASIFNDPSQPEAVITLHEIGHTKGLLHEEMESNNIMAVPSTFDNLEIRIDQCPNFSVSKEYVSPEPWE